MKALGVRFHTCGDGWVVAGCGPQLGDWVGDRGRYFCILIILSIGGKRRKPGGFGMPMIAWRFEWEFFQGNARWGLSRAVLFLACASDRRGGLVLVSWGPVSPSYFCFVFCVYLLYRYGHLGFSLFKRARGFMWVEGKASNLGRFPPEWVVSCRNSRKSEGRKEERGTLIAAHLWVYSREGVSQRRIDGSWRGLWCYT